MKPRYFPMLGSIFAFTAAGGLLLPSAAPALSTEVESNEDVEVLTRGPVHEAFAETVSYEPEAGLIVASAPPALIEELPPEQQPDGDNVTWIPGYWAWDDDQSDFLWISGVWRNIPPGREWVPGYWDELDGSRYQWVSGYWQDPEEEETTYIATAPPRTVDTGPNIAAPDDNHTWVPGNWRYQETRYVWSPGYWTPLRPNWTWVPSRYSWSPRGYVYVDGYWDYAVVNRGVLFAPVYYRRHVWETPGYYYTPSIVVSLNVFAEHLFIRPRCRHYYFGDYYAPRYRDAGFFAPYVWHRAHRGYDPIWAYQRWHHRGDRDWERRYEDNYNFYRDNDRFRPPHTWAAMRALQGDRLDDGRGRTRLFANNFDTYVKNPERGQRFKALNQERRQQFVTQRQEMREFARQRKEVEAKPIAAVGEGGGEGEARKSVKEKLRRSPVVGRQAAQLAENERPPQRPEGRKGRAGAGKEAAPGDDTAPADGEKLTQKEKLRRAAGGGRGPAADGQEGGGNADANGDGTLSQKEKMRRAAGGGANKGGDGATGPDADGPGKGANEGATDDGKLTQKEKMRRAAGGGANKGGDGATGPDADGPGNKPAPNEGATDDGKLTQKEKLRRAAGKGEGQPEPKVNPAPKREEQPQPKREVQPQPKREVQPQPKRQAQPQPKREVQPQPKREVQPQRKEAAPQRQQVQPKREVQPTPQRKQQQKPERKEPKEQASRQQRSNPQIAAQRMAQPKPQARRAPVERKQASQPKPQVRQQAAAQPRKQQQAAPQRQVQRQQAQRQQPQARQATQQRQQATRQAPQQRDGRKKGERDKADN